jgi:mannose-6-phosphate isomerase-like protein (cupin superfamily)
MSTASQQIWFDNPNVGQRSRLVTLPGETGGSRFVLEYIDQPFAGEQAVPPHIHTAVTETFEILRGVARYRLGSETKTARAGDRVVMPPMVTHVHPWSDSSEELHVRQIAEASPPDLPGLNAGIQAAITIQGLAKAGRVNSKGLPNLLQLGVLIDKTMPATYLAGPPMVLQRVLFGMMGWLGRLAGYKTSYPEYGVITANGLEMPR